MDATQNPSAGGPSAERAAEGMEECQLSHLVQGDSPWTVLEEVEEIVRLTDEDFDFTHVRACFEDIVDLFEGRYEGYRACKLEYHNLQHTTDTLLAMVRLMHGAVVSGWSIDPHNTDLGLLTAIMHDTGYIQTSDDTEGTGAKYTLNHIERSAAFMRTYLLAHGFAERDYAICETILRCTGLNVKISEIAFASGQVELLGKMLGAADLLGQMGDRAYLEKLLFLYREFREGGIGGYQSELDLLEKTVGFYETTVQRLSRQLDGVDRFMRDHFRERWNIDRNLYAESIERQINYLVKILEDDRTDYRTYLRRGGLVDKLEESAADQAAPE